VEDKTKVIPVTMGVTGTSQNTPENTWTTYR